MSLTELVETHVADSTFTANGKTPQKDEDKRTPEAHIIGIGIKIGNISRIYGSMYGNTPESQSFQERVARRYIVEDISPDAIPIDTRGNFHSGGNIHMEIITTNFARPLINFVQNAGVNGPKTTMVTYDFSGSGSTFIQKGTIIDSFNLKKPRNSNASNPAISFHSATHLSRTLDNPKRRLKNQ